MTPKWTYDRRDTHPASLHLIFRVYLVGHGVNFAATHWDITNTTRLLKSWVLAPEWRLLLILQQMWQKLLPGADQAVWERHCLHLHWFCTRNSPTFHFLSLKPFTLASQVWKFQDRKWSKLTHLLCSDLRRFPKQAAVKMQSDAANQTIQQRLFHPQNSKLVLVDKPIIFPSMSTSKRLW